MDVTPLRNSFEEIGDWSELPFFRNNGPFDRICDHLANEPRPILPAAGNILRAFELTPRSQVRVVIVGQDPYPDWNPRLARGLATGLAFAVPDCTVTLPSSLEYILAETPNFRTGQNLEYWAAQGGLLVNTILTVPENFSQMSDQEKCAYRNCIGWHLLIEDVLDDMARNRSDVFFMFFGTLARNMGIIPQNLLPQQNMSPARVIGTGHPSRPHIKPNDPWVAFKGSDPFAEANKFFQSMSKPPIVW